LKLDDPQTQIERLIERGEPLERAERAIEQLDRPDTEKAAPWLLAWSTQERRVRLCVAKEARCCRSVSPWRQGQSPTALRWRVPRPGCSVLFTNDQA
jgi:hypothetical protein